MVGATVTAGLSLRSTGLLGSLLGLSLPDIGGALLGGFYAGIIDTISGDIDAADEYQTGARYALIVGPASIESGGTLKWYAPGSYAGSEAKTRWDGLSAQRALLPDSGFEAFDYCDGLIHDDDGASEWYLPALDEMELIYRNLKPSTAANYTTNTSNDAGWPDDPIVHGYNPSSLPQSSAYTEGSPGRTTVTAFQEGGAEALEALEGEQDSFYKTATWRSSSTVLGQQSTDGRQWWSSQTTTFGIIRPVRRVSI